MNTIDILWTACSKTADSIERAHPRQAKMADIARVLRELADHLKEMKAFDSADHERLARIEEILQEKGFGQ